MKQTNNYLMGIDLARITAMFMVLVLHTLSFGGILNVVEVGTAKYVVAWIIESMAFCAVNLFGLISGYVGWNKQFKYSNLLNLWFRVVFYLLAISFIIYLLRPDIVSKIDVIRCFFPVFSGSYWYFTAYFFVCLIIPLLNKGICCLSNKQLISVCCFSFAALSLGSIICPCINSEVFGKDVFKMSAGYSGIWLTMLYIWGGCLSKCQVGKNIRNIWFILLYFATSIGSALLKIHFDRNVENNGVIFSDYVMNYVSPLMVCASVGMLLFLRGVNLGEVGTKIIKKISPLTFSVYLIHMHPLVKINYLSGCTVGFVEGSTFDMLLKLFLFLVIVYSMCLVVDFIRDYFFKLIRLNLLCKKITGKVIDNFF